MAIIKIRKTRQNQLLVSIIIEILFEKIYIKKNNISLFILELMNCTVEVEEQVMRIAARSIGENWRMVFRDLSVPNPEIEQIKEQYFHINLEETIYQLLVRWQQGSEDPSIGILSTVLWNNKCYECVTNLKNYYKKNIRPQSSF